MCQPSCLAAPRLFSRAQPAGPGQAGGGDDGCMAALQLAEVPAHGGGTGARRLLCGSLAPARTQQLCTYTKGLQGLLSCFGKSSADLKTRALPEEGSVHFPRWSSFLQDLLFANSET